MGLCRQIPDLEIGGKLDFNKKSTVLANFYWRLPAFKRIAIGGLNCGGNISAQADGVYGRALGESLEDCHLRGEHVAFVNYAERATCFLFNTAGSIVN